MGLEGRAATVAPPLDISLIFPLFQITIQYGGVQTSATGPYRLLKTATREKLGRRVDSEIGNHSNGGGAPLLLALRLSQWRAYDARFPTGEAS